MTSTPRQPLPALVRRTSRIVTPLLRIGIPVGPMYLLTVTGKRSGVPRTTPVATFMFEGKRNVLQAIPRANWVANVRAVGWGLLGRGRRRPRVSLVEVPVEERRAMLSHAGSTAPAALRRQFVETGLVVVTVCAERLKAMCATRGWSLTELAARAKISRPTLRSASQGQPVRPRTAWKLARAVREGEAEPALEDLLRAA
jgi:hypothetical protein